MMLWKRWWKQKTFFVKLFLVVFRENWLRWPPRAGTLVLNLDDYSVRFDPEEEKKP